MNEEDVGVAIAGALVCFAAALARQGIDVSALLAATAEEIDLSVRAQPPTPAREALLITEMVLRVSDPT